MDIAVLRYQVNQHKTQLADHEERLRAVELSHAKLFAYATFGSVLGGVLTSIVIAFLTR